MKSNEIDDKIRQALAEEDEAFHADFGEEPSLFEQGLELLNSRHRWINGMVMVVMLVFMIGAIYALVSFFQAEELKPIVGWAMGFGFCMSVVSMLKLWAWMEIEKNSTVREIKRLELQIARLTQRLSNSTQNDSRA